MVVTSGDTTRDELAIKDEVVVKRSLGKGLGEVVRGRM